MTQGAKGICDLKLYDASTLSSVYLSILHVSLQILHQWYVSAREQPITARMISRPSGIDHGGLARVDSSNKHYFRPIPWHVLAIRDFFFLKPATT